MCVDEVGGVCNEDVGVRDFSGQLLDIVELGCMNCIYNLWLSYDDYVCFGVSYFNERGL